MIPNISNLNFTLESISDSGAFRFNSQTNTELVLSGPGSTSIGSFLKSTKFSNESYVKFDVTKDMINCSRMCIRICFEVSKNGSEKQYLLTSDCLPFSIALLKEIGGDNFCLDIKAKVGGKWRKMNYSKFQKFNLETWYVADIVYDSNTLAAYVNSEIIAIAGMPNSNILLSEKDSLYVGRRIEGGTNFFDGLIASIRIHSGAIPTNLSSQLQNWKLFPEWYIEKKRHHLEEELVLGDSIDNIVQANILNAHIQQFEKGLIMYEDGNDEAFAINGELYQYYRNMPDQIKLGCLISDNQINPGNGIKVRFELGGLYLTRNETIEVLEHLYEHYEINYKDLGFPVSAQNVLTGGIEQRFENASLYIKNGATNVFSIGGEFLKKYKELGGPERCGYMLGPINKINEHGGYQCELEKYSLYSITKSKVFALRGDIRNKYANEFGGPKGLLGFPTSDEKSWPDNGSICYNTFQNGTVVWLGSYAQTYQCFPFNIFIGEIITIENDGLTGGANDVFSNITIKKNGFEVYKERSSRVGTDDNNILKINRTLIVEGGIFQVNDPSLIINLSIDVWDWNKFSDNTHLGKYEMTLSIANAWGLHGTDYGMVRVPKFSSIMSLEWAIRNSIEISQLKDHHKWWGVRNIGTDKITWEQFATAFSDVDTNWEWYDPMDLLDKFYYETLVETIAAGGNCFGMVLEAIYCEKNRSIFSYPLNRYIKNDWSKIVGEFNIKHLYQLGMSTVWWYLGEYATGGTHNPMYVFDSSKKEFEKGNKPVLCLFQNMTPYPSGHPHCVLPVSWEKKEKEWLLGVMDPNFEADENGFIQYISIDPTCNKFHYVGANHSGANGKLYPTIYEGDKWSGARLYYIPYDVLSSTPRVPTVDYLAIIPLVMVILGSAADTVEISDENGTDLNATSDHMINLLKENRPDPKMFTPLPKSNGGFSNLVNLGRFNFLATFTDPQVYIRSEKIVQSKSDTNSHRNYIGNTPKELKVIHKVPKMVMENKQNRKVLTAKLGIQENHQYEAGQDIFVHKIRGRGAENVEYGMKTPRAEFFISCKMQTNEINTLTWSNIHSSFAELAINGPTNKTFDLFIRRKLGQKDILMLNIKGIPIISNSQTRISLKPGLLGFEIFTNETKLQIGVEAILIQDGITKDFNYNFEEENGVSVDFSSICLNSAIELRKIDNIHGEELTFRTVEHTA